MDVIGTLPRWAANRVWTPIHLISSFHLYTIFPFNKFNHKLFRPIHAKSHRGTCYTVKIVSTILGIISDFSGRMEHQRLCIAVLMAMMVLPFNCLATDYTVGGSAQWNLGVNYTNWASGKTFTVGDKLVFKYTVGQHDTLVVNQAAYTSCLSTNPLSSHTSGNDAITLDSTGTKYYICGITGHCSAGMKLSITVGAASTSKGNGTAQSSSPVPSPSSATPNTPTVGSPSPSSHAPTTPTVGSPSPLSTITPPAVQTPSSSTNGATPPSGSGSGASTASPSYRMGGVLLGLFLLLAMVSL